MIFAGDVPVDQLQTLAFEVDEAGLAELRASLRAAAQELDGAALRGFAQSRTQAYAQTLARSRWRVAPEVLGEVLDRVATVLDAAERREVKLSWDVEPEWVKRDVIRWRHRASGERPLLLRPSTWLQLARNVRFDVSRRDEHGARSRYFDVLSSTWPYLLAALEGADEPLPNDQGSNTAPLTPDLGERVLLDP